MEGILSDASTYLSSLCHYTDSQRFLVEILIIIKGKASFLNLCHSVITANYFFPAIEEA